MLHKPDIMPVISAVVELKQGGGGRFVGLCPFHTEKTPSFVVRSHSYHCFGCGEHGDVIDFVQKYHNLEFKEALSFLSIEPVVDNKQKEKQILVNHFREWESGKFQELCMLIRVAEKIMPTLNEKGLDFIGHTYHDLTVWRYHASIILHGTDKQKYEMYKQSPEYDYRMHMRYENGI